ncbi:MAG: glycosyltransferase [Hyphomicrobiales bacterium]|jgi:glycosyltransferase involved in cell wall biosynthesis
MSRVLHVISGLGTGGAETYLSMLSADLSRRGIDQHVFSLSGGGPIVERFERCAISLTLADLRRDPLRAVSALLRRTKEFNPDVIQGWMYHGDIAATLAHKMAAPKNCKLFWGIRCSDMDLAKYSRQLRLTVQACIAASGLPDLVIANSEAGKIAHLSRGYRPKNWAVIHNGVDLERFQPDIELRRQVREELRVEHDTPVAFHVARLDPMKGHSVLIDAFQKLRKREGDNLQVFLVGQGTEQLTLPRGMYALGRRNDIARLLTGGDIIVSSSLSEGFPNAIAEGMACGLSPVASDVGDTGLLLKGVSIPNPPGDADALANALLTSVKNVKERGYVPDVAARSAMENNFSSFSASEKFERLYKNRCYAEI